MPHGIYSSFSTTKYFSQHTLHASLTLGHNKTTRVEKHQNDDDHATFPLERKKNELLAFLADKVCKEQLEGKKEQNCIS